MTLRMIRKKVFSLTQGLWLSLLLISFPLPVWSWFSPFKDQRQENSRKKGVQAQPQVAVKSVRKKEPSHTIETPWEKQKGEWFDFQEAPPASRYYQEAPRVEEHHSSSRYYQEPPRIEESSPLYYLEEDQPPGEEIPLHFPESFQRFDEPQHSSSSDYRLNVGDMMLISVYGEEGTKREVIVDPRGVISYLFVNSLNVLGKTIKELKEELEAQLRSYYRFVVLSITPIKFSAEYYTVAGEVVEPGKKPIVGRPTLLSALCKAGGLTLLDYRDQFMDTGDLEKSFLARHGEYVPVDFVRLVKEGDLSQDVPLQAGDYIYIPNATVKQIYVLGEVALPVSINYMKTISLAEAIAEAGEVTERASSRVLVLRGSLACPIRYLVDYMRIVKGKSPDFFLQPGDIVYVPPRRFQRLREIFLGALASFVGTVSSIGGSEAFIRIHPHAATGTNVFFGGGGGEVIVAP